MDQRTRKLMKMYMVLHLRDDADTVCAKKEGGRGLTSIQYSVDASIQRLDDYIKKHGERLVMVTRNNTDNTSINRIKIIRKQKMRRKTTVWTF